MKTEKPGRIHEDKHEYYIYFVGSDTVIMYAQQIPSDV